MPECRHATRNFSGQRRFHGTRALLLKTQVKNIPQENILEYFSSRNYWNYILNGKFNPKMDTIRTFFLQNWGTFFDFQKGQGRPPPTPPSKPVSFAEYASIYLNIPKYPWKWLNKLFWLCQGSEYAWSSFMFNRLLKMPWVLNMSGLWIWHDCICKGYTESWICLNMA